MAHELKNSLNVIRISGHYLKRKLSALSDVDEGVKDGLEHLETEVNRSVRLIDYLLQFSKPSKLMSEPLDINTVIEETLPFVEKRIPIQNIKMSKNYSPGLPKVIGDKIRLQQVLLNILINAVQSMPDGGELTITTSVAVERNSANSKASACNYKINM